jgi:hypothetical protein
MRARFPKSKAEGVIGSLAAALARFPGIRWAYLFGSLARGEEFHDADVALMPEPGRFEGPVECGTLGAKLAGAIGIDGLSVEVVDLSGASLPFLASILAEGVALVDREPEARCVWEAETTSAWLDFEPVWREQECLRRESLRREG